MSHPTSPMPAPDPGFRPLSERTDTREQEPDDFQVDNDELLRFALDAAKLGWWDLNLVDQRVRRALRHDQIFGYETLQADWTYPRFLDHVLPADRDDVDRSFQEAVSGGRPWDVECRIRRADGAERHIWIKASSLRHTAGKVAHMIGVIGDQTEHRQSERALLDSDARLRLLDAIGEATREAVDPIVVMQATTRLLGEHLGVDRCAYADVEADSDRFTIRDEWRASGISGSVGSYSLALFGQRAVAELQGGKTLRIDDVERELPSADGAATFKAIGIHALICCPLNRAGGMRGMMAVHSMMPRIWTAAEVALVEAVVERSWAHIERVGAQAVLRENEARLTRLLETVPGIVWTADSGGEIEYVSRWMHGFTGREPDQMQSRYWPEFMHPDDLPSVNAAWQQALTTLTPYQHTFRMRAADGSYRWHMLRSVPVLDEQGRAQSWCGYGVDVHEQKEVTDALAASELRFRDLADHIAQLAWMADSSGALFWYNQRWFDYTGTVLEQMRGWGWRNCHHPDHVERVVEKFQQHVLSGEPWEDLFPLRGADGEYRWFLSRAQPIRDDSGAVVRWFGTNTDVSHQRAIEAELREADQRKDEFIATLAHELRNPLAPIRNGLQLMRLAPNDPQVASRAREMIERQFGQMVRLVDDLLDVSRVSRGTVELRRQQMPLAEALNSAIEMSRPLIDEAAQTLSVALPAAPILIEADVTRLAQVFGNLLNNATKFSGPGGRIDLEARCADGFAEISVRDDGIGIPSEMLPRVFDMFAQVENKLDRSRGGLGIGLTLARRLVEMHGGSIEARSDGPDAGSEFVVRLPVVAELRPMTEPDSAFAQELPARSRSGLRIVVADDNVDAADSLCTMLGMLGHEPRVAYDGVGALAIAESFRPQVMLLDIGMPQLNGYETASRIRASTAGGAPLILIALSGWGQHEDRRLAIAAGFDHHLVKPLDLAALEPLLAAAAKASESAGTFAAVQQP